MQKKKLKIDELKVQSFVTSLSDGAENTVKGGAYTQYPCDEPTDPDPCGSHGCYTNNNCGGGGTGGGGDYTYQCESMDYSSPCMC